MAANQRTAGKNSGNRQANAGHDAVLNPRKMRAGHRSTPASRGALRKGLAGRSLRQGRPDHRRGWTLDESLGFVDEGLGNDPILPSSTEVAGFELGLLRFCNRKSFGEGGASLVRLLGLVLRHRQHHVGIHVAVGLLPAF